MAVSYDQLRTFLAVFRTGSATAAAELLQLSQPTVTAQVKTLEAAMGRALFNRVPRGMAPTVAGAELARKVAAPLDALEDSVGEDLDDPREPYARTLHLGGPAELTCARVLPSLSPMIARGLRLRVTLGLAGDLLRELANGNLDLIVSTQRPRLRAVRSEPLCDEEFVLVGSPGWGPDDIPRAPLVAYAENLPILRRYWRTVFATRLTRPAAVVVPDLRGVLAAVAAGAGITVLPRYLCATELADGRLRAMLNPELPPINTLYLAWPEGSRHPSAEAARSHLLLQGKAW